MLQEKKNKEKLCLFFASDYHFEMISLPYINENLKKDKNIIVVTENNLKETVNKLLSNINLTEEEKDKIKRIDWENNDLNKFFCASDNFEISIENWLNIEEMKVIDCYDINEVQDNVSDIVVKYGKLLSTSGIEKLL